MIDLHMHTTASDGRLTPAALVERAAAAGLTTIAVTDHDTTSSIDEVTRLASAHGIRTVPGIEITSVDDGRDVHMLGYFLDHHSAPLLSFLDAQRRLRAERIAEMGRRLAAMGLPVDVDDLLARAAAVPGTSIGRPWLARALVAAGYVGSVADAFERYLAAGQPAFVPRTGSSPAEVIAVVHAAGDAHVIDDAEHKRRHVEALAGKFERGRAAPWTPSFDLKRLTGIVGIEIAVAKVEGKFKLSQNRSAADRAAVIAALEASGSAEDAALARAMAAVQQRS